MHRQRRHVREPLTTLTTICLTAILSLAGAFAYAGEVAHNSHYVYSSKLTDLRTKSPFSWRDDGSPSGTWIYLYGCHFNDGYIGNPEPTLELRRQRDFLPDESRGKRTFGVCRTAASQNWGNQPVGTYHFNITDFDTVVATSQLHINSTRVFF